MRMKFVRISAIVFLFLQNFLRASVDGARSTWWRRCYDNPPIGCFSIRYPFNNAPVLPFRMESMEMHYIHILGDDRMKVPWNNTIESLKPRFRTDLKTVVIVPGWNESLDKFWIELLVKELLKKEPMNIIIVDWQGGALVFSYLQGVSNGRVAGSMIARFIKELTTIGANLDTFHMICNSLGCHVCGHAGANIPGLKRITAMDPSGRAYDGTPPEARLDPTDAQIVDVIHTDGTPHIGFGTKKKLGTIDFYPNGGHDQPGCKTTLFGIMWDMVFNKLGFNKCSHTRAVILFIDSINRCKFNGNECCSVKQALNLSCEKCTFFKRTATFGYNMNPKQRGIFSFRTGALPNC